MWISLPIKILIAKDEEDIALVYEKTLQARSMRLQLHSMVRIVLKPIMIEFII